MSTKDRMFVDAAELLSSTPKRRDWGLWRLRNRTLVYNVSRNYRYAVDLDRCETSAQVLDWIAQVTMKAWADDQVVAGLVRALDDIIRFQSNLCSCGLERGPYRLTRDRLVEIGQRPKR